MNDAEFLALVAVELTKARSKHKPIYSLHEGYALIREEVDECWDEIKKRNPNRRAVWIELIQTAAMAARTAVDVLTDHGVTAQTHCYCCQFCGQDSPINEWRGGELDVCPKCQRQYDAALLQAEGDA